MGEIVRLSALSACAAGALAFWLLPGAATGVTTRAAGPADAPRSTPMIALPSPWLDARGVAVVVNDNDPYSVAVGNFYARERGIDPHHVIHLHFRRQASLSRTEFGAVQRDLERLMPHGIKALALAWTLPYRVQCMSVTAAFTFGFDPSYCATGCQPTRWSTLFDASANAAWPPSMTVRPAMLLAASSIPDAQAMITRGARSDDAWPEGRIYLVQTDDAQRNVRAAEYDEDVRMLGAIYPTRSAPKRTLAPPSDVMGYFIGTERVGDIASMRFVDGAVADHLTSFGGVLDGSTQMTVLEWIHAGATGSYGTVDEPCNFVDKFPRPGILMAHYLRGETLLESYWKSVRMPGQGLFVGDPLARPFGGIRATWDQGRLEVQTRSLAPGRYQLVEHDESGGSRIVSMGMVRGLGIEQFPIPNAKAGHSYEIQRQETPFWPGFR